MIPRKINCVLDYKKLKQHFLEDVIGDDRRLRFGGAVSDEYVLDYIEKPFRNDMWFVVEDKEKIIKAKVTNTVAKGTIDKLKIYADKTDCSVADMIEVVKPVTSTKNVEYIEASAVY